MKIVPIPILAAFAFLSAGCTISATKPELHRTADLGYVDPARQELWVEPTAEKRRSDALRDNPAWPAEVVRAVGAGEIIRRMTRAQVRAAKGEPIGYGLNPEQGPTKWTYPGAVRIWFGGDDVVAKIESGQ